MSIRLLTLLLVLLTTMPAMAEEKAKRGKPADAPRQEFDPVRFQGSRVTMDGSFTDWTSVPEVTIDVLTQGEYEFDWSGMDDLSAVAHVQHNDTTLFVHVLVRDNALVAPTKKKSGDLVDLWFDMGRFTGKGKDRFYQLSIDPSYILTEQSPDALWEAPKAMAKRDAGSVTTGGARTRDGYEIEVAIPFSELGDVPPVVDPLGFCIVVRDRDHDDPLEEEAAMASCPFDWKRKAARKATDMGTIKWDTQERMWVGVVETMPELGTAELLKASGQLGGDARRDFVVVGDTHMVVMGLGLGPGDWYGFNLGFTQAGDRAVQLDVTDLDGDGDDEIALVIRREWSTGDMLIERDVLHVFDFNGEDHPMGLGITNPLLQAEVAIRAVDGSASAEAVVKLSKKGVTIKAPKKVTGFTKDNWPAPPEGGFEVDVPEMPVPWRKPKTRTFVRKGDVFVGK